MLDFLIMLFPGIKKFGKELGLHRDDTFVYGDYRGFQVQAFDGHNKKVLHLMARNIPPEAIARFDELARSYKFKKDISAGGLLKIEFREILRPYPVTKIRKLLDEVIDILETFPAVDHRGRCWECNENEYEYFTLGSTPLALCGDCRKKIMTSLEEDRQAHNETPGNYLPGFLTAFIVGLFGILPQVLIFVFLQRVAALSSMIYLLILLKGIKWFNIKSSPLAAGIAMFLAAVLTSLGTVISYLVLIYRQVQDWTRTVELLGHPDIRRELLGNLALQLIVSAFYLGIMYFSLRKSWRFPELGYAERMS